MKNTDKKLQVKEGFIKYLFYYLFISNGGVVIQKDFIIDILIWSEITKFNPIISSNPLTCYMPIAFFLTTQEKSLTTVTLYLIGF